MPTSKLSFASTQSFRNALMAKNLAPYNIPGVYSPQVSQITYETNLSSHNVIDSPNNLIAQSTYSNDLYPLNQFGPDGGYSVNINYNNPAVAISSNQGEYDPNDTKLDLVNEQFIDAAYIENPYGPSNGFQYMVEITDIQNNDKLYQPYWSPPSFEPSSYSPYSILLNKNPVGTNGPLSEDSFIAKIGAERLKFAFEERVAVETYKSTVGIINVDALKDPFEALLVASGKQPLINKDYRITVPESPIARALLFQLKLSSSYYPASPIPGDYFEENTKEGIQTTQTSSALNVINSITGGFLGPILNKRRSPSQIFIANTGNGQRSVLFKSLDYNRYQPAYDRTFGGFFGAIQTLAQTALSLLSNNTRGGYYVGSKNSEPSTITSPPNQIPVDPFGRQILAPVYGPSELGILYEGNISKINFGLAAKPSINGGGIGGSFVWTSPKTKNAAGYKATQGGGIGSLDSEFNQIKSDYTRNESTGIEFKQSSILDQTQRLIDSADNVSGIAKLKHVGNAINQVSKVFNDGYKEMTKGSQVIYYYDNITGENPISIDGSEVGVEYCRVFTKDTPYYTYKDLQKSAGITKEGRRFSYSVLDSTYNLNIAPLKGEESTNIVKNSKGERYAKKYMFSLENLAWRTSSRPGFTYDELPDCEKGPNGGRVMWFPPYDISFNDSSTANWQGTPFLGRPEPIFTYKDTTRNGTISWKIIVDSPSVLNVLVDKQLKGKTDKQADSILSSFFAGCVKYDIYTLAKKYNQFSITELQELQQIITQPRLTTEEIEGVLAQIPRQNIVTQGTGIENTNNVTPNVSQSSESTEIDKFIDLAFYFENDIPGPQDSTTLTTDKSYDNLYDAYVKPNNITLYQQKADSLFAAGSSLKNTTQFFNNIIISNWKSFTEGENSFLKKSEKLLKDGNKIRMSLKGSASASNFVEYNQALSERRISSVINYLNKTPLEPFIRDGSFEIISEGGEGELAVIPKSETEFGGEVNCTTDVLDVNNVASKPANTYSVNSMACRRVKISTVKVIKKTTTTTTTTTKAPEPKTPGIENPNPVIPPPPQPIVDVRQKLKDGIGKRILRRLLSECDYFEMIKEDAPFIYDSIKQKIKYFDPAFHAITPEGLNARLTFLNQCVRPGETIPVIDPDGRPKYNDAVNTSFGAPPVLILRIGDFYHTKIIPRNLQITYDPLLFDLNPEGIGVQPMIAKVTLTFDFIGGHGLAKPVEQLQNALSFNYYANTEIYDERAVWTEDTSALDQQIFNDIFEGQISAQEKDAEKPPERRGGKTIGDIATAVPFSGATGAGEAGVIAYQKVADQALSLSKQYFTDLFNTAEKISEQYNFGIWQLVTSERDFTEGDFLLAQEVSNLEPTTLKVEIFGKPKNLDTKLQYLGEQVINDIKTDTKNYIIKKMFELNKFTQADIEKLRNNLEQYVTGYLNTFSTAIFDATQIFTISQQDMVQNFRKLNVINSRTDGKILENGKPFIYSVDGTNEVTQPTTTISTLKELRLDYEKLGITYNKYNDFVKSLSIFLVSNAYPTTKDGAGQFTPLSAEMIIQTVETKRFYMVMCRIFSDKNKLIDFKNFLLREGLKDVSKFEKKLEKVLEDFKDLVDKELDKQKKYFDKIRVNQEFINYQKLDTYAPGKVRKFKYTSLIPDGEKVAKEKLVKDVWSEVNVVLDKKTWDGKLKFD